MEAYDSTRYLPRPSDSRFRNGHNDNFPPFFIKSCRNPKEGSTLYVVFDFQLKLKNEKGLVIILHPTEINQMATTRCSAVRRLAAGFCQTCLDVYAKVWYLCMARSSRFGSNNVVGGLIVCL